MKKTILMTIAAIAISANAQKFCYVSNDYDFQRNPSKSTATICLDRGVLTLLTVESGLVSFKYEIISSWQDSATGLPYVELVGGYERGQFFVRMLYSKYINIQRTDYNSWNSEFYNVRVQGEPHTPTKRYDFVYSVPRKDSASRAREKEYLDFETKMKAKADTIKPDYYDRDFLTNNIKSIEGLEKDVEVEVSFYVEEDGTISDIQAVTNSGTGGEAEAIRVLKLVQKAKPGTIKGVPVRMKHSLKVTFAF